MVQILPDLLLLLDEPIREDNGRHLRQQNIRPRRGFWVVGVERGRAYDERGARGRRDASCEDAAGCAEHRMLSAPRRRRASEATAAVMLFAAQ